MTAIIKIRLAYKAEDVPLEQPPQSSQEDEVRRYRRRSRQAESRTRRRLLNGGLAVWAGAVTVALALQLWPDREAERTSLARFEAETPAPQATTPARPASMTSQAPARRSEPTPEAAAAQERTETSDLLARRLDTQTAPARRSPPGRDQQDAAPSTRVTPAVSPYDEPAGLDERAQAFSQADKAAVVADPSEDTNAAGADSKAADQPLSDIAPFESAPQADQTASANIARAQFTSGIEDREPVDRIESVPARDEPYANVYYFTDIVDMSGETVTHRWEHEGATMAEVSFDIGSDRWRTWSSKQLTPDLTGEWRVVVTDAQGTVLKTDTFVFAGP